MATLALKMEENDVVSGGMKFAQSALHRWGRSSQPAPTPCTPLPHPRRATTPDCPSTPGVAMDHAFRAHIPIRQQGSHSQCASKEFYPVYGNPNYIFKRGWRASSSINESRPLRERPVRLLLGPKLGSMPNSSVQDLLAEIVVDDCVLTALQRNLAGTRVAPFDLKQDDAKRIEKMGKSNASEGFFEAKTNMIRTLRRSPFDILRDQIGGRIFMHIYARVSGSTLNLLLVLCCRDYRANQKTSKSRSIQKPTSVHQQQVDQMKSIKHSPLSHTSDFAMDTQPTGC